MSTAPVIPVIAREVVSALDGVRLIANAQNRGFTGGMNQGIADATGRCGRTP